MNGANESNDAQVNHSRVSVYCKTIIAFELKHSRKKMKMVKPLA